MSERNDRGAPDLSQPGESDLVSAAVVSQISRTPASIPLDDIASRNSSRSAFMFRVTRTAPTAPPIHPEFCPVEPDHALTVADGGDRQPDHELLCEGTEKEIACGAASSGLGRPFRGPAHREASLPEDLGGGVTGNSGIPVNEEFDCLHGRKAT